MIKKGWKFFRQSNLTHLDGFRNIKQILVFFEDVRYGLTLFDTKVGDNPVWSGQGWMVGGGEAALVYRSDSCGAP